MTFKKVIFVIVQGPAIICIVSHISQREIWST